MHYPNRYWGNLIQWIIDGLYAKATYSDTFSYMLQRPTDISKYLFMLGHLIWSFLHLQLNMEFKLLMQIKKEVFSLS